MSRNNRPEGKGKQSFSPEQIEKFREQFERAVTTAENNRDPSYPYQQITYWCDKNLPHYTDAQLDFLKNRIRGEIDRRRGKRKTSGGGAPRKIRDLALLHAMYKSMPEFYPDALVHRFLALYFNCSEATIKRELKGKQNTP